MLISVFSSCFKNRDKLIYFNDRFREEVKQLSLRMRDQPFSPQFQAAYWVEYVVRHKGASHLRSHVVNMSWLV